MNGAHSTILDETGSLLTCSPRPSMFKNTLQFFVQPPNYCMLHTIVFSQMTAFFSFQEVKIIAQQHNCPRTFILECWSWKKVNHFMSADPRVHTPENSHPMHSRVHGNNPLVSTVICQDSNRSVQALSNVETHYSITKDISKQAAHHTLPPGIE